MSLLICQVIYCTSVVDLYKTSVPVNTFRVLFCAVKKLLARSLLSELACLRLFKIENRIPIKSYSQLSNKIGHACTSRGYFSSDIGHDRVADILQKKITSPSHQVKN